MYENNKSAVPSYIVCKHLLSWNDGLTTFQVCLKAIVRCPYEYWYWSCLLCTFLLFILVIKRASQDVLLVKVKGGQNGTVPVLCRNIFQSLSEAKMKLRLSELNESSEYLPKLLSFQYKVPSLYYYASTAAQQESGEMEKGNSKKTNFRRYLICLTWMK